MFQIKITLKSDLCTASGAGYTSVIDTDIVADEYGIPYIPARRLKGCLREAAANVVDKNKIKDIFGESGTKTGGNLKFSSHARLDGYEKIKNQLIGCHYEEVINLFTYTRAATKIDTVTGSAEENSLRFIRVIKQYDPLDNETELVFVIKSELDKKYKSDMERICKALRNIGYKRNRGFGVVSCVFDESECKNYSALVQIAGINDDVEYVVPIVLKNQTPLMISSRNNDETLDYIPGGSVLGAFASKYPYKETENFAELYLKDNVKFSNCYVGVMPAPLCYAKLKKSGKYINLAAGVVTENDAPKHLKDKYLSETSVGFVVSDIAKEIIYHHSTGEDSTLYTQSVLSEGQKFAGSIAGKGKYLKQIFENYKSDHVRVGKSKTAQYAYCSITYGEPVRRASAQAKGKIAVILKSDVLLLKNGIYTTDLEELVSALGIPGELLDKELSMLAYTVISGYSGVFNLKKPQAKAYKAGSVLVFNSVKPIDSEFYIGVRQNEGFGLCEAVAVSDMKEVKSGEDNDSVDGGQIGEYRSVIEKSKGDIKLKEEAITYAKINRLDKNVKSSQIGRFLRMLEQSSGRAEFMSRIDNIKTKSVKQYASDYFGAIAKQEYTDFKLFCETLLKYEKFMRKIEEAE